MPMGRMLASKKGHGGHQSQPKQGLKLEMGPTIVLSTSNNTQPLCSHRKCSGSAGVLPTSRLVDEMTWKQPSPNHFHVTSSTGTKRAWLQPSLRDRMLSSLSSAFGDQQAALAAGNCRCSAQKYMICMKLKDSYSS